jgi:hypothetical protein
MDVLMALGAMCVGIGATLIVLGTIKSFAAIGLKTINAGIITGLVGVLLMAVGAMSGDRKEHVERPEPRYREQTDCWQPSPGGGLVYGPGADGRRVVPDQMPLPGPYQPGPGYGPFAPGAPGRTIDFRGQVQLAGTFQGTAVQRGNGGYGQGSLAVECGAQQFAVGK